MKKEILRRLSIVADYLEHQAQRTVRVAEIAGKAPARDLGKVLSSEMAKTSKFAATLEAAQVESSMHLAFADESSPETRGLVMRQAVVGDLSYKAKVVVDYAQSLRRLRAELVTVPAEEVASRLAGMYIPPEAITVLRPQTVPLEQTVPLGYAVVQPPPFTISAPLSTRAMPFIVGPGGSATVDFPAVGAVVSVNLSGRSVVVCTGTLISERLVVTAGHCLSLEPRAVFFQHAGLFEIEMPVPHPENHVPPHPRWQYADLAVLRLKSKITGITPALLNDIGRVPEDAESTIVGFGWRNPLTSSGRPLSSDVIIQKTGLKLHAIIKTSKCSPEEAEDHLICWIFKDSGIDGVLGSTCHGDSGGPLFAKLNGEWRLAGVTSGGRTCKPGDRASDVELFDFVPWLKEQIALIPNDDSSGLEALHPLFNEGRYAFAGPYSFFDSSVTQWQENFIIGTGFNVLRVAVTATPSVTPLRLEVRSSIATSSTCSQIGEAMQSCEISLPISGQWEASIIGDRDQEFQVVATGFRKK
jgi:hypothetical protein